MVKPQMKNCQINNLFSDNTQTLQQELIYSPQISEQPPEEAVSHRQESINQVKEEVNSQREPTFEFQQTEQHSQEAQVLTIYQSGHNAKKRTVLTFQTIQRIKALFETKLNNPAISIEKIASTLCLGYSTVCQLQRQWLIDRSLSNRIMKLKRQSTKRDMLGLKRSVLLRDMLRQNPFLTQDELKDRMNKDPSLKVYNKPVSNYIVYSLLKQNKFMKKRTIRTANSRNTPNIKQIRRQYCQWFESKRKDPSNLFFYLDQIEINLYTVRDTGWCKQGEDIVLKCSTSQAQNVSLLLVIGPKGFVYQEIVDGLFDQQKYLKYLKITLDKIVNLNSRKNIFLIQDNSSIHAKKECAQISLKYPNANVIFLPSNSPQLNPIQNYFHTLKAALRRKPFKTRDQMKRQVQKFIENQSQKPFDKYYQSTQYFLERGIRGLDF